MTLGWPNVLKRTRLRQSLSRQHDINGVPICLGCAVKRSGRGSRGIYTVEVAGLPVEQLSKGSGGSTPSIPTINRSNFYILYKFNFRYMMCKLVKSTEKLSQTKKIKAATA